MSSSVSSPDWIDRYAAALIERDNREQLHSEYINAYTKLALRSLTQDPPIPTSQEPSNATDSIPKPSSPVSRQAPDDQLLLSRLRQDLSTTNKARTTLTTQFTDLTTAHATLSKSHSLLTRQHAQLQAQRAAGERKLKDYEDEIRGQTRLAQEAQDEMVALGLQLHLKEAEADRLRGENEELVRRWVARMGEEVDRVNRENDWR